MTAHIEFNSWESRIMFHSPSYNVHNNKEQRNIKFIPHAHSERGKTEWFCRHTAASYDYMQPALKVFSPSLVVVVVVACACVCLYTHRRRCEEEKIQIFPPNFEHKKDQQKMCVSLAEGTFLMFLRWNFRSSKFEWNFETFVAMTKLRKHPSRPNTLSPPQTILPICMLYTRACKRLRATFNGILHGFSLIYSPFIQLYQLVGLFLLLGLHFKHLRIQLQHVIVLTSVAVTEKCSRCVFHGSHVWNDWAELTKRATCCRTFASLSLSLAFLSRAPTHAPLLPLKCAIKRYKMYEKWLTFEWCWWGEREENSVKLRERMV